MNLCHRQFIYLAMFASFFILGGCPGDLPAGQIPCGEDAHCPDGQICGSDGYCEIDESRPTGCLTSEDCPDGVCENGLCTTEVNVDQGSILALDPGNEIDFGSPALGVPIEKQLIVKNLGEGPFSVLDARIATDTSDEFVLETATPGPWVIEGGGQLDITVKYTLADGEEDLGAMLLTTTAEACDPACSNPTSIQVDFFSEFKGERNLALSPSAIDFGYVGIGEISSLESLLVSNEGTLDKILTVTSISLSGPTDQFQYILPETPLYIFPGQGIPMEFSYAPTNCDDHLLTITVNANSDSPDKQSLSATLNATAPPPNPLLFDPPTLSFDPIEILTSQTLSSNLKLVGCDPVTLTSGQMESGFNQPFSPVLSNLQNGVSYTLQPGGSVPVNITYTPIDDGTDVDVDTYQVFAQDISTPVELPVAGRNYVPPSVAVTMGPEVPGGGAGCVCTGGNRPIANVDLSFSVSPTGPVCKKPADPSCGFNGGTCPCNMGSYGTANWRAFTLVEDIMVDEEVVFEGANSDANYVVSTKLLDDCHASAGIQAVIYGCCFADCENDQTCFDIFDYYQGVHCPTYCEWKANSIASSGCMYRGAVPVKTTINISSDGIEETHVFCTTLAATGSSANVVTLEQSQNQLSISQIHSGTSEISPGASCQ